MLRTKRARLVAALAVAGVVASGGAFAAKEREEGRASRAEIAAVLTARTAPLDAIRAAESKSGGRAVEFGLEKQDAVIAYEVQVVMPVGLVRFAVDPTTGTATASTDAPRKLESAQSQSPLTTLVAAVAAAERQTGGRALEASAEISNGQPVFAVTAVKPGGDLTRVTIGGDAKVLATTKLASESAGDETDTDAD